MNNLRLNSEELEAINDGLKEYMRAIMDTEIDNTNFTCQIAIRAEERFFQLSLTVDVFNKQINYWIIDTSEMTQDEYLDSYNATFNQNK